MYCHLTAQHSFSIKIHSWILLSNHKRKYVCINHIKQMVSRKLLNDPSQDIQSSSFIKRRCLPWSEAAAISSRARTASPISKVLLCNIWIFDIFLYSCIREEVWWSILSPGQLWPKQILCYCVMIPEEIHNATFDDLGEKVSVLLLLRKVILWWSRADKDFFSFSSAVKP